MTTTNTITLQSIKQRRDATRPASQAQSRSAEGKISTTNQDVDKRRNYFREMSDLITVNFALTDDEISLLLKITRVKLAYNVLNFAYAALIQSRGNVDQTLNALRTVSMHLYELAGTDIDNDTEALDAVLKKNGLPLSATAMPSLIGIERMNIIHNAPSALTTFAKQLCAKYEKEFGSLVPATKSVDAIADGNFPEAEREAARAYLSQFDHRDYRQVCMALDQAAEYFAVFPTGSQQDYEAFVKQRCPAFKLPKLTGSDRDKVSQATSYRMALIELINVAH